jgi:hypothetical protein
MKKLSTMKLSGNEYAKVATRVLEFVKDNKNSSVITSIDFKDETVIVRAKIIPDVENPEHYYTGTSFGRLQKEKALEKLETVAVGRALAFAGYCANGEIATDEEMEKYTETKKIPTQDIESSMNSLKAARNLDELKTVWLALPQLHRENEDILDLKNEIKKLYETINVTTENRGMAQPTSGQNNGDIAQAVNGKQDDQRSIIL